jgi:hypothetical protein
MERFHKSLTRIPFFFQQTAIKIQYSSVINFLFIQLSAKALRLVKCCGEEKYIQAEGLDCRSQHLLRSLREEAQAGLVA